MTITVFKGVLLDDDWIFEVADDDGTMDVSPNCYGTAEDALDAALRTLNSSEPPP